MKNQIAPIFLFCALVCITSSCNSTTDKTTDTATNTDTTHTEPTTVTAPEERCANEPAEEGITFCGTFIANPDTNERGYEIRLNIIMPYEATFTVAEKKANCELDSGQNKPVKCFIITANKIKSGETGRRQYSEPIRIAHNDAGNEEFISLELDAEPNSGTTPLARIKRKVILVRENAILTPPSASTQRSTDAG